jgi:tetratricopeptide (TPR) repeat protein
MQVFEEIAAENPEYPGLQTYLDEANRLQGLESRYQEAQRLYDLNDLSGALAVYEEIDGEDPFYKDVAIRIESIQNQFFMGDMLSQAEKAFEAQDWQQAASGFETVRAINQQFQPEHIESRLYDSYINAAMAAINADTTSFENLQLADSYFRKALTLRPQDASTQQERDRVREIFKDSLSQKYVQAAQAAIGDQEDSLQALETAEEYFRQALALRPDDPDILLQRDLARSYLQAQADYSSALWDKVIVSLEQVYAQDPQYAKGTSLQTLYEAYMARGENYLSFSNYEEALSDFTRAISLAEQSATPKLRLFSAQIRAAEAKGALGDYEDAVFQYQDALIALDLDQTDIELSSTTTRDLDRAENYVRLRYYKHAYNNFRKSTPEILAQFSTIAHVVESGEYLTMLANRYNTTVEAIVKANNLNTSKQIQAGQEIIVPGYTGTQ